MARKQIDWEAVERDYRLGQLSLSALAEKHGTTKGAISKKASAGCWVKDASSEVRERTKAALIAVPSDREGNGNGNIVSTNGNAPTREDIEVAVQTNLAVINRHRKDIGHGQRLVGLLFSQLEDAALCRAEIEAEIERECADDSTGARRAKMLKAVALPTHAATIRDLSTALKNLIPLERQAYNLDEVNSEETYEQRLARLMGGDK